MSEQTVIEYLIERLYNLGVEDFFGLPGDFNFKIVTAVEKNEHTNWRGCCNELNASYAADGYSRVTGLGCCITTYGVGELCALNGIAGAYAQNIPIVKIVGIPSTKLLQSDKILHHTLGDRRWFMYADAYRTVIEHGVVMSKENAYSEIEEALNIAVINKKPVYLAIPEDVADAAIERFEEVTHPPVFDDEQTAMVIFDSLKSAQHPVLLLDSFIMSFNLQKQVQELVNKLEIPFITTHMGKGCINESSPYFCGVFAGNLLNEKTAKMFKESDCILSFGLLWTDFNSSHFSMDLRKERLINIDQNWVDFGGEEAKITSPQRLLDFLLKKVHSLHYDFEKPDTALIEHHANEQESLSFENMFPLVQNRLLQKDDIVVSDTGLSNMALLNCKLPDNCKLLSQLLYASIGWATPCAFGAQSGAKERRVILFSGDGSAQLTAQEFSSMYRYGQKPVIFILNNSGYTTERILSDNPETKFNDIAHWDWTKLPEAFGADSYIARVKTVQELLNAVEEANKHEKACFVEVMLPEMDMPAYARQIYEMVQHKRDFNS